MRHKRLYVSEDGTAFFAFVLLNFLSRRRISLGRLLHIHERLRELASLVSHHLVEFLLIADMVLAERFDYLFIAALAAHHLFEHLVAHEVFLGAVLGLILLSLLLHPGQRGEHVAKIINSLVHSVRIRLTSGIHLRRDIACPLW